MTMDADDLEMFIDTIRTLWARPLDDYEEDQWRRMLRPDPTISLDAELVGETLTVMKAHPAFEHTRPDIVAFRGHYDRIVDASKPKPPDPSEQLSTTEQAMAHLDAARALLTQGSGPTNEEPKLMQEQLQ